MKIRHGPQDRGLAEDQIAALLGIVVSSYRDLESRAHEWLDLPLGTIRALSSALRPDILQFAAPSGAGDSRSETAVLAVITDAFRASGKSVADLCDELGVRQSVIEQALSDARALDQWPVSFVLSFCEKLDIPFRAIV